MNYNQEIEQLIGQPKSEILEYKAILQTSKSIAELICSFANTKGGFIVFGVSDNLEINGLSESLLNNLLEQRETNRIEFHGLNLDKVNINNIGIILKTESQASRVLRDILWLVDSKRITKDLFGYILYFDHLVENVENLLQKNYVQNVIKNGYLNIQKYYEVEPNFLQSVKNKIDMICKEFKNYNNFEKPHHGWQSGISFPCLNSNKTPVARALVALGLMKFTKLGRYLIDLPILQPTNCLENNEHFVRVVLNPRLHQELEIDLTYYSVGDLSRKKNLTIDDFPFYTEPNDEEWNYAHGKDDY